MKQLLLYFLFFVFSALIFLQCAKMFPSPVKAIKRKPPISKNESTAHNNLKKEPSNITRSQYMLNGLKSSNIWLVSDNSPMPYPIEKWQSN